MTPLAHRIAKELLLPKGKQRIDDAAGIARFIGETHGFEVSQARDLIFDTAQAFCTDSAPSEVFKGLAFLPAPTGTLIEFVSPGEGCDGDRVGFFLRRHISDPTLAYMAMVSSVDGVLVTRFLATIPLDGSPCLGRTVARVHEQTRDLVENNTWIIYAALSVINSPRRINQRVLMMHKGLQRDLRRKGVAGIFPANAYKEVTLHAIPKPLDASDAAAWQDYNSNCMPLHFVRAHRRRSDGMKNPKYDQNDISTWDLIEAHWRGNAAFGIKLTKYKVAA